MKPIPTLTDEQLERFWSKIDQHGSDDCWEWQAGNIRGYGHFFMNGHTYRATRVAYSLLHGSPPLDKCVCHTCDHPPCCNPAHLFLGTFLDNNQDRAAKGRSATNINPQKGERNGRAKITERDVKVIRRSKKSDQETADEYGLARSIINKIRNRKLWKHV